MTPAGLVEHVGDPGLRVDPVQLGGSAITPHQLASAGSLIILGPC